MLNQEKIKESQMMRTRQFKKSQIFTLIHVKQLVQSGFKK